MRVGLPDVFRAGAGEQQPHLRVRLVPLGLCARERQLGVGGVEACDDVAGLDAVALVDAALEKPAAYRRGDLHVGHFDLTGDANAIGGRRLGARAGGGTEAGDQEEYSGAARCSRVRGHDVLA